MLNPPRNHIDSILSAQLLVAWAGEHGEPKRLGWWASDLTSKYGGEDLLKRLLPTTWRWGVFQSVREAARRHEAELRAADHAPDRLVSLFHLGLDVDEKLEERLQELKQTTGDPCGALPSLTALTGPNWTAETFNTWLSTHGEGAYSTTPIGRRLKGVQPDSLDLSLNRILSSLSPLAEKYPLPYYIKEA
jgi:hypothetical protein